MNGRDERERRFQAELREALRRGEAPAGPACVDEETLAVYVEGKLGRAERRALEDHVAGCARCRETLGFLAVAEEDARPAPQRSPSLGVFWRPALATLASASIAVVVAIRLFPETERPVAGSPTPLALAEPEAPIRAAPSLDAPATLGKERSAVAKQEAAPAAPLRSEVREKEALADAPPSAGDEAGRDDTHSSLERLAEHDGRNAGSWPRAPAPQRGEPASESRQALATPPAIVRDELTAGAKPRAAEPEEGPERNGVSGGSFADDRSGGRADADSFARAPSRASERAGVAGTATIASAWRLDENRSIQQRDPRSGVWATFPAPPGGDVFAVAGPSATIGWAVGADGRVHRTKDGVAWERVSRPTEEDLVGVSATSAEVATVVTRSGSRFVTTDGGRTWTALSAER